MIRLKRIIKVEIHKIDFYYHKSKQQLNIIPGFLLALERLKTLGYSVDMKVLDVSNDSVCMTILDSTILDDRSLIVGPLHANQFKKLASRYGSDSNRRLTFFQI